MSMNSSHFILYSNCIPVKGAARSLLCDLQRNRTHFIPNDLYDILDQYAEKTIGEIQSMYEPEDAETIMEYFEFLVKEEYIFLCDSGDLELFPKLSLDWDSPSCITNAIIDVGAASEHPFDDIFRQLEDLGCQDIQIRFYRKCSIEEAIDILLLLEKSSIRSVELFIVYNPEVNDAEIKQFVDAFPRLSAVFFHSAPSSRSIDCRNRTPVLLVKEAINDATHCGFIAKKYFSANLSMFTESQKHNSCLNRKISIDEHGAIRNCPSMPVSYGNIRHQSLKTVVGNLDFTSPWHISKDQIETCKVCEFRYICTDCRAFTKGGEQYTKPLKCNYNPYTAEWEASIP